MHGISAHKGRKITRGQGRVQAFQAVLLHEVRYASACAYDFIGHGRLILGFVTIKTDSIVPAILIHGFNNGMSAVSTVFEYALGSDASTAVNFALFVFWIVAGIISIIVLMVKKEFSFRLDAPKAPEPFANTTAQKVGAFISSPVLIISSLYLIFSVISSIQKI